MRASSAPRVPSTTAESTPSMPAAMWTSAVVSASPDPQWSPPNSTRKLSTCSTRRQVLPAKPVAERPDDASRHSSRYFGEVVQDRAKRAQRDVGGIGSEMTVAVVEQLELFEPDGDSRTPPLRPR